MMQNCGFDEISGKNVLEIGSRDVNGSIRSFIQHLGCKEYIGIDISPGQGVDKVMDAQRLPEEFIENSFDIVICLEMLEHAKKWKEVVNGIKFILRPGGIVFLTTRSPGFPYHSYPWDFWRFTYDDIKTIFSDFLVLNIDNDIPSMPGVFIKALKKENFDPKIVENLKIFSILNDKREQNVPQTKFKRKIDIFLYHVAYKFFEIFVNLRKRLYS